jgi:hypothetical protein
MGIETSPRKRRELAARRHAEERRWRAKCGPVRIIKQKEPAR